MPDVFLLGGTQPARRPHLGRNPEALPNDAAFHGLVASGGEPMLRRELAGILHLFYENNGIRWVNLPTNGLLPERTAAQVAEICTDNPKLQLDLNVAMDGLHEVQDSIRGVPGNFEKTLKTLDALQPCREKFANLRVNINTVICAENFDSVLEIACFVRQNCRVDGHYFNIIRGSAKDPSLKRIPTERLPSLYGEIRKIYAHYARIATRHSAGMASRIGRAYYEGVLAFHNKVQLDNMESPHAWPMPCTAGETSVVIDYNGDVRACELRGKLGNLRDFACDFQKFWQQERRRKTPAAIVHDHVLVHARLFYS